MRIAGIDADSKLWAVAAIGDEGLSSYVIKQQTGRVAADRQLPLLTSFAEWIGAGNLGYIDAVYIEHPIAGRNIGALRSQAYVVGTIRWMLHDEGLPTFMVDNTTWKKQVIGSGKAAKEDIKAFCESLFPQLPPDQEQDVYDAIAIAQFGRIARR